MRRPAHYQQGFGFSARSAQGRHHTVAGWRAAQQPSGRAQAAAGSGLCRVARGACRAWPFALWRHHILLWYSRRCATRATTCSRIDRSTAAYHTILHTSRSVHIASCFSFTSIPLSSSNNQPSSTSSQQKFESVQTRSAVRSKAVLLKSERRS